MSLQSYFSDKMTKVEVDSGICGKRTLIEVKNVSSKIMINFETNCPKITKLSENLKELDISDFSGSIVDNRVYRSAQENHITCPVPCAILKAMEVEFGLALKKDTKISFIE